MRIWHEIRYKNKMKFISYTLFISLLILSAACKDENEGPADKTLPTITKLSPQYAHQAYDFNDTAFFRIDFSDNESLKETSLRLYLASDSTLLFMQQFPNAKSSSIDTFIIMNDSLFTEVKFKISATDASGNVALQSSHIHLRY